MNWAEITKRDPPSGFGGFLCRIGFHRPERAHEGRRADYLFCDRCGVRWVNDWGDPHRVSIRSREIAEAWKERAEIPTLGPPPRGMAGSAVQPATRRVRVELCLPDGRTVAILADRADDAELLDGIRSVMMDAKGIEQQGRAKDAPIPLVGLDRFQEEVRAYAAERFPEATLETTARHLFREAVELVIAVQAETHGGFVFLADLQAALCSDIARDIDKAEARIPQTPMEGAINREAADVGMLALGFAGLAGFSLLTEMRAKLLINRGRGVGEPDAAGVREHLKEADQLGPV